MAVILVIDDDADMLDLYGAFIREMGHEPVTKVAVESAPETIRDIDPDALLVDLRRPDEDEYGLRVIEELRADPELKALPIVLCTAGAQEVRPLLQRLDLLDVAVVLKPFSTDDLERTLASAIAHAPPA
jgi:CheY-like chemotaxis protein